MWMRVAVHILLVWCIVQLESPVGNANERADALLTQARSVLAQIDGQVEVDGLQQPVSILRDRWGIAHIEAQNTHDLFFAQGYSMAQDRLFQVDLWLRIARGETAELLGDEAIPA